MTPPAVRRVSAADLAAGAGALRDLHDGVIDALVVEGLFDADAAAAMEAGLLAGKDGEWLLQDRDPRVRIRMIGALISPSSVNPRGPDPEAYLAAAERSESEVAAAVGEAWFPRLQEALTALAEVPARAATAVDGRPCVPTTIRGLPPGGAFAPHCEAGYLGIDVYRLLRPRVCLEQKMGYFLQVAPADAGGELVLYDVRWDPEHRAFEERIADVDPSIDHTIVPLSAGDLVLLDAGHTYHQVTEVRGDRTRWTMGGFAAFTRDGEAFEYWS